MIREPPADKCLRRRSQAGDNRGGRRRAAHLGGGVFCTGFLKDIRSALRRAGRSLGWSATGACPGGLTIAGTATILAK
jgi:hypothetical protein